MNVAQVRKLIGKDVTWLDTYCPKRGYLQRQGKILDIKGKNVFVDRQGFTDWLWLPEMVNLKEIPSTDEKTKPDTREPEPPAGGSTA